MEVSFFPISGHRIIGVPFFFKALGLLLFVVEIVWFFVTPIMKDIKV
jgi:hypothetical protein